MITIGYSTRTSNPTYKEYLQKTCMYKEVQIIEKINNGDKSLSQVYNEILEESEHDIVVLCHDDLEFDTKNWGEKVLKSFEKNPEYGILGLAGTKFLDKSGQWWIVPQTMYGIVNHKHEGKKWTSTYSPHINDKIEETIIVDGLFIAVDKTKIKHKFDVSIDGFHFYDLGFCLPNFLAHSILCWFVLMETKATVLRLSLLRSATATFFFIYPSLYNLLIRAQHGVAERFTFLDNSAIGISAFS